MRNGLSKFGVALVMGAAVVFCGTTADAGVKGKLVDPFNYTLSDGRQVFFTAVFNPEGTMVETRDDNAVFVWDYTEVDLLFVSFFRANRTYESGTKEEDIPGISLLNILVLGSYSNDDGDRGSVFGIIRGSAPTRAVDGGSAGSSVAN